MNADNVKSQISSVVRTLISLCKHIKYSKTPFNNLNAIKSYIYNRSRNKTNILKS